MPSKPIPLKDCLRARLSRAHIQQLLRPRSFARFAIIGGLNTVVGVGNFPLLYWLFGRVLNVDLLVVLGWILSTSFAFFLHKLVTFESEGAYHNEGAKFLLLALMTLGINILVMNIAVYIFKAPPVLVQVVIATVLSAALMVFNYLGMARFIFVTPSRPPTKD